MTPTEIKKLRDDMGLTQMAFAVKLGISLSAVQFWEAGTSNPSPMAAALLKKAKDELKNEAGSQ